ncbi:phosphotransferase [Nonomuraea polychroma]|uniref:phosphotransferase n=1 Tax=Nonomuraea polychroma TaxID=46176 RepID=UPI000FDEAED8|nr:phosphotransferase [Nonomuraea polychroma]
MISLGEKPLTARERGFTAALLAVLEGDAPPPFAVRRFLPLPTLSYDRRDLHTGAPAERDFGAHVDQTNYSVVVDEKVVVKWMTPPVPLPHPAPDILAHLVEAGFNDTAPPYAALTGPVDGRDCLLALVTGYLPGARDGWEWCVDEAQAGTTAFAADLGRLTADLHLALATLPPPTAAPLPENGPTPALLTSTDTPTGAGRPGAGTASTRAAEPGATSAAARAEGALAEALEVTDGEDGRWLAARAQDLRRDLAALSRRPITTPRVRIHGDLHVGQILRWRDGYAVIDFDGNPTVTDADPHQPPARDVAQLTTSLEHAAQVAIKRRGTPPEAAAAWAAEARAIMVTAYKARLTARNRPDLLDETLIRPFEVEQECRELIYAARHLPRWRYAPMGVLRTWYPEQNPEENIA